jgi:hypothetical protein
MLDKCTIYVGVGKLINIRPYLVHFTPSKLKRLFPLGWIKVIPLYRIIYL